MNGAKQLSTAKPCPLICPPRPSGNMPAAPGQIPPRRSATAWEAPRRTSTVRVRTTVLPKGRSCGKRHLSAATAVTPGGCTTCSATSGSGAATAPHQDLRAASVPGGHPQRPSVPAGCGTGAPRRLSVAPGSASAWRLSVPIPERCSQSDNLRARGADPEKGVSLRRKRPAEPDLQLLKKIPILSIVHLGLRYVFACLEKIFFSKKFFLEKV